MLKELEIKSQQKDLVKQRFFSPTTEAMKSAIQIIGNQVAKKNSPKNRFSNNNSFLSNPYI